MKILHYNIGLPPGRTGGLTYYSLDLMNEEYTRGNDVRLLFPGRKIRGKKTKIRYFNVYDNIKCYELINSYPVPVLFGIKNPINYYKKCICDFTSFFNDYVPDIIHLHSLMGLPKEFVETAKSLGSKVVITTHDYYGICPKVNLIDYNGKICLDYKEGQKCVKCNVNSYKDKYYYMMQTRWYKLIKKANISYYLKKYLSFINKVKISHRTVSKKTEYVNLRNYYFSIYNLIDYFLFNSPQTRRVFKRYLDVKGSVSIISHKDISDHRAIKVYNKGKVKFGFLGNSNPIKGFSDLKEALTQLTSEGYSFWELHVYGKVGINDGCEDKENKIFYHSEYQRSNLSCILSDIDVVVVPSICLETFCFTVLESLSFGIPVIVSETVGAKDIVCKGCGLIYKQGELKNSLQIILSNPSLITEMSENICKSNFKYSLNNHVTEIINIYENIIDEAKK